MFERVRGAAALGVAALAAALTAVFIAPVSAAPTITSSSVDASQPEAAAEQVLTWTADDSVTEYASFPTTATAGPATIVFENSEATGNTTYMTHTLTFDTTNPEYNQDVDVDIVASPNDPNGGRHEVQVNLSPGTYRYYCAIPGHSAMSGILVVTDGGGDDTTPPEVSAEVSGDQDADGNYVGSATVTVSASDAGSGVASVEYEIDDTGFQPYTDPVTVDEVGDHSVQFRATDVAGNVSEVGSVAFTVVEAEPDDSTPPEVAAEVSGEQDADGNYVGSATVTLAASDDDSGVASVEYDLNGAGFVEYTDPIELTEPGHYMVDYRATDNAGNTSEADSVMVMVVEAEPDDTTPPEVSAEVSGEQDADGNYVGSATVTVSASDAGSGVASVEYEIDDTGFQPYTDPVTVDEVGDHSVQFRATDVAGNVSETGSVAFTVVEAEPDDTTPPEVSADVSGDQDADGNYVGSATVTLDASDAGSGVASVEYDLDGAGFVEYTDPVTVDEVGDHTVQFRATDVAGNVSEVGSVAFTVVEAEPDDTTPPEVSAEVSGEQDADGNYVGSATVTVSASDAGSGVDTVEYDLDGAGFVEYTDPVTVDAVGDHTVQFRATDVAGNVSETGSVEFTVVEAEPDDSTPPEVSAQVSGEQDADGNFVGSATVTLDASDAGSGVDTVEYDLDGAGFAEYTDPVTVDEVGDHSVQFRATDVAGNVSEVGSVAFTVVAGEPGTCSGDDRDTVWLRGVDTGVPNYDAGEGCTVNDLIEDERDWAEHGAFVRHVGDVTADLVEDGVLTSRERSTLVRAAASSEIGKPGDGKVARSLVRS